MSFDKLAHSMLLIFKITLSLLCVNTYFDICIFFMIVIFSFGGIMYMESNIGNRIKTIRKRRDMTQKQLAAAAGLAEITIQTYETGKYKPGIDSIKKLASALSVDPSEIDPDLAPLQTFDSPLDFERARIRAGSSPSNTKWGRLASIEKSLEEMNDSGQEKVAEYADDLARSGKYKK